MTAGANNKPTASTVLISVNTTLREIQSMPRPDEGAPEHLVHDQCIAILKSLCLRLKVIRALDRSIDRSIGVSVVSGAQTAEDKKVQLDDLRNKLKEMEDSLEEIEELDSPEVTRRVELLRESYETVCAYSGCEPVGRRKTEYLSALDTESEGKSNCFVATAAYGTPDHPRVETLRELRDRILSQNRIGRIFTLGILPIITTIGSMYSVVKNTSIPHENGCSKNRHQ